MPLTTLRCYNTQVFDLSPLQGMKLDNHQLTATPSFRAYLPCKECGLQKSPFPHTQVSDPVAAQGMPVATLNCDHTKVSDLSPLEECKSLTFLKVKATKVTPATVAALQKALPNCKIEWDDPAKPKTPEPAASGKK